MMNLQQILCVFCYWSVFLLETVSIIPIEAANFACVDPTVVTTAEQARIRSALFWTGRPLPGDWSSSCPITVRNAEHSGGGATRFRFENGEVFDWSMTIEGPREQLLRDVIPHEVDHAVRASLVRHPIERWLDEGCASLFESHLMKEQLRQRARHANPSLITLEWLSSFEYPSDSGRIEALYAVGFSLVEYLLQVNDPPTLLAFQKQDGSLTERLAQHYSLTPLQLRENWSLWRTKTSKPGTTEASNTPATSPQTVLRCQCPEPEKPLLIIWTAKWCGGCRHFWQVWNSDSELQLWLKNHFHIHVLDYDEHQGLALLHGIRQLPSFQTQSGSVVGFKNGEELLRQLALPTVPDRNDISSLAATEERIPANEFGKHNDHPEQEVESSDQSAIEQPTDGQATLSEQAPNEPFIEMHVDAPSQNISSRLGNLAETIQAAVPVGFTLLQWTGILSGTAATGGMGGLAVAILWQAHQARRKRRTKTISTPSIGIADDPYIVPARKVSTVPEDSGREAGGATLPAPFPRELDEASQLLEIRQSEGRVAILDALRGMFLDDEVEKLKSQADPLTVSTLSNLLDAIDQRVNAVAPLSTRYSSNPAS